MTPSEVAEILSVLSTERRCRILQLLIEADQPIASSMIASVLDMSEASTSYNLKAMLRAGVIIRIPSGRWVLYLVNQSILDNVMKFFKSNPVEVTSEHS